jgi:Zn-dependent peptidase ImmA (M78 family)
MPFSIVEPIMNEALQHKFEAIFAQVINTGQGRAALLTNPKPIYLYRVDGSRIELVFHFVIRYQSDDEELFLAFRYMDGNSLVTLQECKYWGDVTRYLNKNTRVCLVSDVGFEPNALKYVRENGFDIDHRLLLAKYSGDDAQSLVLNRLWTNYTDPRGRTGVLTSNQPCAGAVLSMRYDSYNAIGILSELDIPIKPEYEFKCPFIHNDYIEHRALKELQAINLTEEEIFKTPDFLWRIVEKTKLKVEYIDMGEDFFGEYSYADKTIYLNSREHNSGQIARERFTLAHELGHHFLHADILRRYNYTAADDQDTFNLAGASNQHIRYFESQANKFASSLLMPKDLVKRYANNVMLQQLNIRKGIVYDNGQYSPSQGLFNHRTAMQFVEAVADQFRVSKEAARFRLKELELLREEKSPEKPLFMI